MRKFIFVLLTLLLVSPFSFAMKGIIWQPQNRDSQVTDTQWQGLIDAPRDKCAHFREINGIAAAFQYSQKNYIPTALSFL